MDSSTENKDHPESQDNEPKEHTEQETHAGTSPEGDLPRDVNPTNTPRESQEPVPNPEQPSDTNIDNVPTKTNEAESKPEGQAIKTVSGVKSSSSTSFSRGIPKRYILLMLVFFGFVNIYGLRINLNVALVAMVNNRTYTENGVTVKELAEFHWDSKTQGKVSRYWYFDVKGELNAKIKFVLFERTLEMIKELHL